TCSRLLCSREDGVPVDLPGRVLAQVEGLGFVPRRLREVQLRHLRDRRRQRGGRRGASGDGLLLPLPLRRRGALGRVRRRRGRLLAVLGPGEGLADGGELGVHGGVERAGQVRAAAAEGREVEPRHVAAEAERRLVVGERRVLGGVEGAEPQPRAVLGEAYLRHPLAPVALPHAAVQLRLRRRQRRRPGLLHRLRPRAQERRVQAPLLLLLRHKLGLDLLDLGRAELVQAHSPSHARRRVRRRVERRKLRERRRCGAGAGGGSEGGAVRGCCRYVGILGHG
ncbi:hypothetical protein BS78_04G281700, partial [Paspalum vaginatum]